MASELCRRPRPEGIARLLDSDLELGLELESVFIGEDEETIFDQSLDEEIAERGAVLPHHTELDPFPLRFGSRVQLEIIRSRLGNRTVSSLIAVLEDQQTVSFPQV